MQASPTVLSWLLQTLPSILVATAALIISLLNRRDKHDKDLVHDTKAEASAHTEVAVLSWTLADRLALEKRLVTIEHEINSQKELHDIMERLMAKVLHSPHRPALDELLEKIDRGESLSDAQVMFISDWLYEIATDSAVTKGEQTAAGILLALINRKYKHVGVSH